MELPLEIRDLLKYQEMEIQNLKRELFKMKLHKKNFDTNNG